MSVNLPRPSGLLLSCSQFGVRLVARVGETGLFTFLKAFPRALGRPLPLFPWPGEMEKGIVLDDPAIKLEGHLSAFAATRQSRRQAPDRGHGACPWSVRERTNKARTAFLGCPLARVGGGCIEEHS